VTQPREPQAPTITGQRQIKQNRKETKSQWSERKPNTFNNKALAEQAILTARILARGVNRTLSQCLVVSFFVLQL